MERERAVEIFRKRVRSSGPCFGSGYLLDGRHVLTARHVIAETDEGADHLRVRMRVLGGAFEDADCVVWDDRDLDLAIVALKGRTEASLEMPRIGLLKAREPVKWRAIGFPAAMAAKEEGEVLRDTLSPWGLIAIGSRMKSNTQLVSLGDGSPEPLAHELWSGMSGAPVFAEANGRDLLMGVICETPLKLTARSLNYVPLALAIEQAAFPRNLFRQGQIQIRDGGTRAYEGFPWPLVFVDRTKLKEQIAAAISRASTRNVIVMYGPPGSGKMTLALDFCRTRDILCETLDFRTPKRSDSRGLDALIVENLFKTDNPERELAWLNSLECENILVTTSSPSGYSLVQGGLADPEMRVIEVPVGGLSQGEFELAIGEICRRQQIEHCSEFASNLFRQTGGLPIALQLAFNLMSRNALKGSRLSSSAECSLERLLEMFRLELADNDRDAYAALFALANVPRFGMCSEGLAKVLGWEVDRAEQVVAQILQTGLARPAKPPDAAIRIHDTLAGCFTATDGEVSHVREMKYLHCLYWTQREAATSPITLFDSMAVSSEIMFTATGEQVEDSMPLDGLRVMAEISMILDEVCDQTVKAPIFGKIAEWIVFYIQENFRSLQCHTVIPLALFCLRFPDRSDEIGEAFARFWETCDCDDPTIVAPAISVSAYHLGHAATERLKIAMRKLENWRMDQRELVAAAFAYALATLGEHWYAARFVTGHNTRGIAYAESLAGIALALQQRGDTKSLDLFKQIMGIYCRDIDQVTTAFLRRTVGGLGVQHYGAEVDLNMNRVCFLAKLFRDIEFDSYANKLLRKSVVISASPPVHRVQRAWL